jgi:hypothetical protein
MSQIKIVDTNTNEEVIRDKTTAEITRDETDQVKLATEKENALLKISSKIALFQKLGLTQEEAKLLIG